MEEDQRQPQVIIEDKTKQPNAWGKKKLLFAAVLLAIIAVGVVIVWLVGGRDKEPAATDTTSRDSAKVEQNNEIRDTTTITSQASMLKIALGISKTGGTVNGVSVASRGFYPSTVDMKNASWLKENIQVAADTHKLIESGEIVYEPKGCKADQPSGEDNKCSGFILRVDGKVVAENQ